MVIYGVLSIFGLKANCFQWCDYHYQLSFDEVTSPSAKMSKYYKVSKVLAVRSVDGRKEYRVRWSGFGSAADSWVKEEDCNNAIKNYGQSSLNGKL